MCVRVRACVVYRAKVRRRNPAQACTITSTCVHFLVVLATEAEDAESAAKLKAEIEALKSAATKQASPYRCSVVALLAYRTRQSD